MLPASVLGLLPEIEGGNWAVITHDAGINLCFLANDTAAKRHCLRDGIAVDHRPVFC